jgi:hypothetical protein
MIENTIESLVIGWFYKSFPLNVQKILERSIRRAATFEDAKRTIRLCMTGDWARQEIRLRMQPEVSIFVDSTMQTINFKEFNWGAITRIFWDRLRKRNYHYSQIHTIVYERTVGIFNPTQYSHMVITDDPKIIKDVGSAFHNYKIREPLISIPSKNKTEEFNEAVERVKNLSKNPRYQSVVDCRNFGYIVSIGCVQYEPHYSRPLYQFESRY